MIFQIARPDSCLKRGFPTADKVSRVNPHHVAEMDDFHKIHRMLAMLNPANVSLTPAESLSHIYLAQLGLLPNLPQQDCQFLSCKCVFSLILVHKRRSYTVKLNIKNSNISDSVPRMVFVSGQPCDNVSSRYWISS